MSFEIVSRDLKEGWFNHEEDVSKKYTEWSLLHDSETEDYEDAVDDGWMLKGWVGEDKEEKQKFKKSFKHRVMSAWMNAKHTWAAKVETDFKEGEIIWMCGRYYKDYESLCDDFYNIPWFTYRSGFPEIGPTNFTSDMGWGCMVRSGQMGLALVLKMLYSDKNDWICEADTNLDRSIIRLFGDIPLRDICPLSFHSLVGFGHVVDKPVGEWFGPASIATVIKKAIKKYKHHSSLLEPLFVYIAPDSTIYLKDLYELYDKKNTKKNHKKHEKKIKSPKKTPDKIKKNACEEGNTRTDIQASSSTDPPSSSPTLLPQVSLDNPENYNKIHSSRLHNNDNNRNYNNNNNFNNIHQSFIASNTNQSEAQNHLKNSTNGNTPKGNPNDVIQTEDDVTQRALLILVPLRLGNESLNKGYQESLKLLFRFQGLVGVLGGKPKHSVFFVGVQGNHLIYLDPHQCQDMVDISQEYFSTQTYHNGRPLKMAIEKLDPSCCLVLLCKNRAEIDETVTAIKQFQEKIESLNKVPKFNKELKKKTTPKLAPKCPHDDAGGCKTSTRTSSDKKLHKQTNKMYPDLTDISQAYEGNVMTDTMKSGGDMTEEKNIESQDTFRARTDITPNPDSIDFYLNFNMKLKQNNDTNDKPHEANKPDKFKHSLSQLLQTFSSKTKSPSSSSLTDSWNVFDHKSLENISTIPQKPFIKHHFAFYLNEGSQRDFVSNDYNFQLSDEQVMFSSSSPSSSSSSSPFASISTSSSSPSSSLNATDYVYIDHEGKNNRSN